MKNNTDDGIFCDYCGYESKEDFTYYSLVFKQIDIKNEAKHNFYSESDAVLSIDMCVRCMELFEQRLIAVGEKVPTSSLRCDVTGATFSATNSVFYRCYISKADVNMSQQPYVCNKCGKQCDPQQGPCQCEKEARELTKDADVAVDEYYLQLNFSGKIFDEFKRHVGYIRNIGEAEWSKT